MQVTIHESLNDSKAFGRIRNAYNIMAADQRNELVMPIFLQIIKIMPAGLAHKLHFSLNLNVHKAINHFYALLEAIFNPESEICNLAFPADSTEIVVMDIENILSKSLGIVDLHVEIDGFPYYMDFTSDPSLLADKARTLQSFFPGNAVRAILIRSPKYRKTELPIDETPDWYAPSERLAFDYINSNSSTKAEIERELCSIYDHTIERIAETELAKEYQYTCDMPEFIHSPLSVSECANDVQSMKSFYSKLSRLPFQSEIRACLNKEISELKVKDKHGVFVAHYPKNRDKNLTLIQAMQMYENVFMRISVIALSTESENALGIKSDFTITDMGTSMETLFKSQKAIPARHAQFIAIVKKIDERTFQALFAIDIMDENLIDKLNRQTGAKMATNNKIEITNHTDEQISKIIGEYEEKLATSSENLATIIPAVESSISNKIIDLAKSNILSDNSSKDIQMYVENITAIISRTLLFGLISHTYEIAKTFSVSIGKSKPLNTYRVGFNGPYDSITLTQISGTADSFTTGYYATFYKKERDGEYVRKHMFESGDEYATKFRSFDKNTLSWALRLPFVSVSLASHEIEYDPAGFELIDVIYPILLATINRDTFAQASEQIRYFYTSTIGKSAKVEGIFEKITPHVAFSELEVIYIARMLKLTSSIQSFQRANRMNELLHSETDLPMVAFPHSRKFINDFSYVVSSMYYRNVYNKFRSDKTASQAICFSGLLDEEDIFKSALAKGNRYVAGFSASILAGYNETGNLLSFLRENFNEIINDIIDQYNSSPDRYKYNAIFIAAASCKHGSRIPSEPFSVHQRIGRSMIDTMSMRGAMEYDENVGKGKSTRAFSSAVEGVLRYTTGFSDPAVLEDPVLSEAFADTAVDVLTLKNIQAADSANSMYEFRVVDKDQIGHREISVLNFNHRCGAFFVEEIMKEHSVNSPVDILEKPNKYAIIEQTFREYETFRAQGNSVVFDNADQSRWGPNSLTSTFLLSIAFGCKELHEYMFLINNTFKRMCYKVAKVPDLVINVTKTKDIDRIMKHDSALGTLIKRLKRDAIFTNMSKRFAWGMGQGILHQTSSFFHSICAMTIDDAILLTGRKYGQGITKVSSLVTSDDAFRAIAATTPITSMRICVYNGITTRISGLCNIVRNNKKSSFNYSISEMNSVFSFKSNIAVPSLKQRIAKIEIGSGTDLHTDLSQSLSNAANYLMSGGSLLGAYINSVLGIAMNLEHYNAWSSISNNSLTSTIPELGALPIVNPIITALCGSMSNFFLALNRSHGVSADAYSTAVILNSTAEIEMIDSVDTLRTIDAPSENYTNFKIPLVRSANGLINLVRYKKNVTSLVTSSRVDKWKISDDNYSLNKHSNKLGSFFKTAELRTRSAMLYEFSAARSDVARFVEPWVNSNSRKYKIPEGNSLFKFMNFTTEDGKISPAEIEALRSTYTESGLIRNLYSNFINHSSSSVNGLEFMTSRVAHNFSVAKNIHDVLNNSLFGETSAIPSTYKRISIRKVDDGIISSDMYKAVVLKTLSGEIARKAIEESGLSYDSIETLSEMGSASIKESAMAAEGAINTITKWVLTGVSGTIKCLLAPKDEIEFLKTVIGNQLSNSTGKILVIRGERTALEVYTLKPSINQSLNRIIELAKVRSSNVIGTAFFNNVSIPALVEVKCESSIASVFSNFDRGSVTPTFMISNLKSTEFKSLAILIANSQAKLKFSAASLKAIAHGKYLTDSRLKANDIEFRVESPFWLRGEAHSSIGRMDIIMTLINDLNKPHEYERHIAIIGSNASRSSSISINIMYDNQKVPSYMHDVLNFINVTTFSLNEPKTYTSRHGTDTIKIFAIDDFNRFDVIQPSGSNLLMLTDSTRQMRIPLGTVGINIPKINLLPDESAIWANVAEESDHDIDLIDIFVRKPIKSIVDEFLTSVYVNGSNWHKDFIDNYPALFQSAESSSIKLAVILNCCKVIQSRRTNKRIKEEFFYAVEHLIAKCNNVAARSYRALRARVMVYNRIYDPILPKLTSVIVGMREPEFIEVQEPVNPELSITDAFALIAQMAAAESSDESDDGDFLNLSDTALSRPAALIVDDFSVHDVSNTKLNIDVDPSIVYNSAKDIILLFDDLTSSVASFFIEDSLASIFGLFTSEIMKITNDALPLLLAYEVCKLENLVR